MATAKELETVRTVREVACVEFHGIEIVDRCEAALFRKRDHLFRREETLEWLAERSHAFGQCLQLARILIATHAFRIVKDDATTAFERRDERERRGDGLMREIGGYT